MGRWMVPDPYGQHASPYLAMSNNPISFVDPDGGYDGWYQSADGGWYNDDLWLTGSPSAIANIKQQSTLINDPFSFPQSTMENLGYEFNNLYQEWGHWARTLYASTTKVMKLSSGNIMLADAHFADVWTSYHVPAGKSYNLFIVKNSS